MTTDKRTTKKKAPHGTEEWAVSNVNIQHGCEHDCKYCYAKAMAIRFKRKTAKTWKKVELRKQDLDKKYTKRDGRVMFPSSHDITGENIGNCIVVLKKLLQAGNNVLIVMKPELKCVRKLCKELYEYKPHILFRFTIGSANNRVLHYWEPGAPTFDQRLKALKHAYDQRYQTSVSCEPMLDEHIDKVITAVKPYVTDAIWLGKANQLRQIVRLNNPGDRRADREALKLIAAQNDDAIKTLYKQYRVDRMVKWKDSIKNTVGIQQPTQKGLDL